MCIYVQCFSLAILKIASSRRVRKMPDTHCLHMCLISPRCGDSGLFSDSSVLCDVRVWTRYSILIRIL